MATAATKLPPGPGPTTGTSSSFAGSESPMLLVYHCWICAAEFFDKLGIIRHLKEWHKDVPELRGIEKKMKTPICMQCGSADLCEHQKHRKILGAEQETGDDDDDSDYGDDDNDYGGVVQPRFISCISCGETFNNPESLQKHRETAHPNDKSHQCMFCPSTFAEHRSLVAHARIHTGYRPYICMVCGNRFPKSCDLKRHSRIHSGERPFKCAQCNQTFTQKGSLEKHARIHARRSGGHACLMCGLVFMQVEELNEHTETDHSDVNWKCKVCGKMYTDERYLLLHEKSHDVVKPYACSQCDRTFSLKMLLLKHESKSHCMKKEIKCEECGKTFKRRENLTRHKLSHSGVKAHKCSECGMAFTEKGSLTRHFKSQHDQLRPHSCLICGKAFTRRNLLRRHMERFHDSKGSKAVKEKVVYFRCKLCKKLLRKSGLRQHMRHHKSKGDEWEGNIEDEGEEVVEVDMNEAGGDEEEEESRDGGDVTVEGEEKIEDCEDEEEESEKTEFAVVRS